MQQAIRDIKDALTTTIAGLGAVETAVADAELQEALGKAVDTILGMSGRLICVGMGKSGHIARKLAATFASTGTPALFVHPAEASHGDLGMIQHDDVLLMLSWSGETRELGDILTYGLRHGVPIIALTGRRTGTLASKATIPLVLPEIEEACPHNLAPTSSTSVQLALGDALAIALLKARGFSEESFRDFHPGGKLGAILTPVTELMVTGDDLPLTSEDAPIIEVIGEISRKSLGIVGLTNAAGDLTGIITDGDIRRYLEANSEGSMKAAMWDTRASAVMTTAFTSLEPDRLSARAMNILQSKRIGAAFVLDGGKPIGLITMLRLLAAGVA